MLMVNIVHLRDPWKDQVRFVGQPTTVNEVNNHIEVLLEISSLELYSQEEIQRIIDNH